MTRAKPVTARDHCLVPDRASTGEADLLGGGDALGPVGGSFVGEVTVRMHDADPEWFRSVDPGWRPTLPSAPGEYALADLLPIGSSS